MLAFLKLTAFQALLHWLTLANADEEICPSGWTFVENVNRCYKYLATPVAWDVALRKCSRQNASLPTIHDRESNNAIGEFTARRYYAFYHIGLRQAATGEWQWTDGSPLGYANWTGKGSPNSNERRCAAARVGLHGVIGWFAQDCDYTEWPTVCERRVLKRKDEKEQLETTPGGSSAVSVVTYTADTTTQQHSATATTSGANQGKGKCKDKASAWKCESLTAVYACKASAYFKYLEQNCARSCGFCN